MRNTLLIFSFLVSNLAFADINSDLDKARSRIPDAGTVKYKNINNLRIGENATSEATHVVPTPGYFELKKEVRCKATVTNREIQTNSDLGVEYLTPNSAIALAGTLYTCH